MYFNKVCIIGLGLIGGSLGKCIKYKKLVNLVYGIARRKETINIAKRLNVIDTGSVSFKKGVEDAELIIICTPVSNIVPFVEKSIKYINKETIITDVGSTKYEIVKEVENLLTTCYLPLPVHFIGGHPLAGSEKSGIEYSEANLFENTFYILTKTNNTNPSALNKLQNFVKQLGAYPVILTPQYHDYLLAHTSHLSHIAAFSLATTVFDLKNNDMIKLSSRSFKEITRVVKSNPKLWLDIFQSNKYNIINALQLYKKNLSYLEDLIKKEDNKKLMNYLREAKINREKIE